MPRRRIGLATAWSAATVSICWKDTITPEQVLHWSDVELAGRPDVQPWLFPLTTRSRVNPGAPQPTRADFEVG